MQILQGDYSNLKCFVTLTTLYSRFDVKVENTQQLPLEIPLASFFVVLQKKTTHKYYIIFHKNNKNNNNKQTNRVPFIVPMVCWLAFTDCGRHFRDALTSEKNSKRYPCKRTCHITASILRLCVLHKRANISQLQVALQET